MSSRALKRLEKQQQQAPQETQSSSDEEELAGDSESESDAEEEEREQDEAPIASPAVVAEEVRLKKSSKKKRNKHKKVDATREEDWEDPEVQTMLQEMANQQPPPSEEKEEEKAGPASLPVDTRFLNPSYELKQLFGAKVLNAQRQTGPRRHVGRANASSGFKSVFLDEKPGWPPLRRSGLFVERFTPSFAVETAVTPYRYRHTPDYMASQMRFFEAIAIFDPQALMLVLRDQPWHVNALLTQAGITAAAEGNVDHTAIADLIERAVFTLEQSLPTHLSLAKLGQTWQLPYTVPENRAFFLTFYAHLHYVLRRGAWRCAYELGKCLLHADANDPMRLDLILPMLAIRAKQFDYFSAVLPRNVRRAQRAEQRGCMEMYHVLAALAQGQAEEADRLAEAWIAASPSLFLAVLKKAGLCKEEVAISFERQVAVERSATLWKETEHAAFLGKLARFAKETPEENNAEEENEDEDLEEDEQALWRHISTSPDLQHVIRLPADVVENNATWAHDPFPPFQSEVSQYDDLGSFEPRPRRGEEDLPVPRRHEYSSDSEEDEVTEEEQASYLEMVMNQLGRFFH